MSDMMRAWTFICQADEPHIFREVRWASEGPPACPHCTAPSGHYSAYNTFGEASAVAGDECDIWIRHGLCNADGSPRHFTSKSEIKEIAAQQGLCILGETPKPTAQFKEGRLEREAKAGRLAL